MIMANNNHPIGVFDSGVGGLSVLRDIREELQNEELIYVADSLHAPYGDKPMDFIEARSTAITDFLIGQNAKAVVVACNTATAAAVAQLRSRFSLPIVAMEPAVKPAVAGTKSGVVGVLATRRTVGSDNFSSLLERFGSGARVLAQACPGLVEQVELGDLEGARTIAMLEKYLQPLILQGADTIVLGCTHYPFLAPLIRRIVGDDVAILDPGVAIARELRRRLAAVDLLADTGRMGGEQFWSSGSPASSRRLITQLWGRGVEVCLLPEQYRLEAGFTASA